MCLCSRGLLQGLHLLQSRRVRLISDAPCEIMAESFYPPTTQITRGGYAGFIPETLPYKAAMFAAFVFLHLPALPNPQPARESHSWNRRLANAHLGRSETTSTATFPVESLKKSQRRSHEQQHARGCHVHDRAALSSPDRFENVFPLRRTGCNLRPLARRIEQVPVRTRGWFFLDGRPDSPDAAP